MVWCDIKDLTASITKIPTVKDDGTIRIKALRSVKRNRVVQFCCVWSARVCYWFLILRGSLFRGEKPNVGSVFLKTIIGDNIPSVRGVKGQGEGASGIGIVYDISNSSYLHVIYCVVKSDRGNDFTVLI